MKKKQKLKERICALVLALAMVLTWVLPDAGMTVQAAGGTEVEYTVSVTDEDGALADVSVSAQNRQRKRQTKERQNKEEQEGMKA